METIKVIIVEYVLGYGLQSFAFVLGIYAFNRQKIIISNYMLASILVMIMAFLVRLLPISFGVHTLINMLFSYLICIIPLKMPAYKTIRSVSLVIAIILISEMVTTTIIMAILGNELFESLMKNSFNRSLIGIPSNILFALVVTLSYYIIMKKGDNHRNISSQDS